ncbi:tetratricopeptide repeat protein [Chloroflexota bacterium]
MSNISLRTYNSEIRNLIDSGDTEAAIEHCHHILHYYPKHVYTYRLLGEAYLAGKQHNDASDIFQRVLSSIPDDFVSHVGMSVIREEDEKLDESIWHMERAFEVQPANTTIQGELLRLYGLREGVRPHKVRLTRGALAHMYIKGDLYQQAIAEIHAALSEDQNRLDLKILLADVYLKMGQENEAAEVASDVLTKLPFSFDANYIMTKFLIDSGRDKEAQMYHDRLEEIDPYASKAIIQDTAVESIPDQAVTVEKLGTALSDVTEGMEADISQESIEIEHAAGAMAIHKPDETTPLDTELSEGPSETPVIIPVEKGEESEKQILPTQSSDWFQEELSEPALEDDTKPVRVSGIEEIQVDSGRQEPETQSDEPADIPDWLAELAEEETLQESAEESVPGGPHEDAPPLELADTPEPAGIPGEEAPPEITAEPEPVVQLQEDAISEPKSDEKSVKPFFKDLREDVSPEIQDARKAFNSGDIDHAMSQYDKLIKSRQALPIVISDLQEAVDSNPKKASIWHQLGDAYLRNNQISEAMDAYSKAEDLI